MNKLETEITIEFAKLVLQYGKKIEEIEKELEKKGTELGTQIKDLEDLEGQSVKNGDCSILINCPMTKLLKEIKQTNEELTGINELPLFYKEVIANYIKLHPGEEAILHPLCIVHQIIRKNIGKVNNLAIQQVACRSMETGKVVIAKNGIKKCQFLEKDVTHLLAQNACLYLLNVDTK